MTEKRLHVKAEKSTATAVPWHGTQRSAPDEKVMCDGNLTTSQEAWADVTRCDKCDYCDRWGIGD